MWRPFAFLAATVALAQQQLLDSASFGHRDGRISPNLHAVPAWHLSGTAPPMIHSDRIMLTPPYPGNKNAAAWTDVRLPYPEWQAELAFRASGTDRGGGNLQLWYTKENQEQIGANSVYTVGKFEGLAIVVDAQGGKGGGIRGFLNDGTTDYKSHHHLEALAFGHCDYTYRNLGRPSLLKVKQDGAGFEVTIDGRQCFRSDDVILPSNNYFGLTAASAETPDSFEVFRFATTALSSSTTPPPPANNPTGENYGSPQQQQQPPPPVPPVGGGDGGGTMAQQAYKLDEILRVVRDTQSQNVETRRLVEGQLAGMAKADQMAALQAKVISLEASLAALRKDVGEKDYTSHFNDLRAGLNARHDAMLEYLPEKMHTRMFAIDVARGANADVDGSSLRSSAQSWSFHLLAAGGPAGPRGSIHCV